MILPSLLVLGLHLQTWNAEDAYSWAEALQALAKSRARAPLLYMPANKTPWHLGTSHRSTLVPQLAFGRLGTYEWDPSEAVGRRGRRAQHVVHFEKWHRAQYLVSHAEGDLMSVGENEEAIVSRHFVLACVLILVDDSSPHREAQRES